MLGKYLTHKSEIIRNAVKEHFSYDEIVYQKFLYIYFTFEDTPVLLVITNYGTDLYLIENSAKRRGFVTELTMNCLKTTLKYVIANQKDNK